ncbi:hypothetical protein IPH25_04595 [bacterium]|nr:MAG: hypothetical protein IPG37_01590 [bacterium]QQR61720.1 MAG: hypothetical protein IPH25_04595 [bacterium]QQR62712.1 MAG: hypothetical protein IPH67_04840 [bacterium]
MTKTLFNVNRSTLCISMFLAGALLTTGQTEANPLNLIPILFKTAKNIIHTSILNIQNASAEELCYLGAGSGVGAAIGYLFYYATPFIFWSAFKAATVHQAYHGASMVALFFGVKYALGMLHADEPLHISDVHKKIDFMVSGFFIGYFAGLLAKSVKKYREAKNL